MEVTERAHGVTESSTNLSMVSVDEALRMVLAVAQGLLPVTVPLHNALGMVLAEDVRAPDPLPPYPASIKVSQNSFLRNIPIIIF